MARTVLGATLTVEGEVRATGDVCVLGRVQGRLEAAGDVRVETSGAVAADITGRNVDVLGEVTGNITAQDRAEVHAGGQVHGDIRAPKVMIANGAVFKGNVVM